MVERRAGRKIGYSAPSGLSGGVVLAVELWELHSSMVGSRHTRAVVQVAMIDSDSMVEVLVLVARYILVEVHILSRPFHLPCERSLVRMPLTAED